MTWHRMKTMHENQYISLNGYKMLLLWLTKIARVHVLKTTKGSPLASTDNVVQVAALITPRAHSTIALRSYMLASVADAPEMSPSLCHNVLVSTAVTLHFKLPNSGAVSKRRNFMT
jgi:hypothetical protein